MAIYGSLGDIDVGAIDKSIADTATDIFVYDTRKDSDGGAWRKRTQHTSWYNETLNTATRGSRREFPAVAVIVAETSKVTIYDGDDPDIPMWMVFNTGSAGMSSTLMLQQNGYSKVVCMLNGILVTGTGDDGSNYGQPIINFISEKVLRMDSQSNEGGIWLGNIADRDSSKGYASSNEDYVIASSQVNDVAMTVLPNAPIDPSTGLPIPTIAVATAGGVSIIKDDGTIISSSYNAGYPVKEITIFPTGELYHRQGSGSNEGICFNYPYTRISGIDLGTYANNSTFWYASQGTGNLSKYLGYQSVPPNAITTPTQSFLNIGDNRGLTFVDVNKSSDVASHSSLSTYSLNNGMVAYATTSYNTGWMHGDIKGAWLSDTSTASVTGTELITNGNFSGSNLSSYFNVNNCSLAVVSNQLVMTSNTGNYYCEFYMNLSDTTKPHYLSFQFVGASNLPQFGIYASPATGYVTDVNAGWSNQSYVTNRTVGTYTILIPAGNSQVGLVFPSPAVYTWTFDNISLKPVQELDRSVNNRGLAVYGTITKTPVATGAELVAYSGFSSSNYLYQPYNSALDFGTGDFCYMCWVMDDSVSSGAVIFQRGTAVNSNETVFYIDSSYRLIGRVQTTSYVLTSNVCFVEDQWNHCVFLRRSGTIQIYHNGILQGSATNTETATQVGQGLSIGAWLTNNYYFPTSISLFRVSASAPSPEQIKKIYEDEKVLFQENAKCTLYGSSNAVTALAYDDDNQLLHVGTSSGRSDFQGLRRINNTTTAVTTAISASNGLIAEQ